MSDLISIDDRPQSQQGGLIYQLDLTVIDQLPKRNTKQGLSTNTRRIYKSAVADLNKFLKNNDLHLSIEALKLYFDDIKGKLKASTLNLRKSALIKCVKACLGEDNIQMNLAIDKAFQQINSYKIDKSVPYDEVMTEDEIRLLIKTAQSEKTRLIIQFLYKTACRVSEIIGIRLTDCKPINSYIKIRVIGKGSKERDVAIPKDLYEAIN